MTALWVETPSWLASIFGEGSALRLTRMSATLLGVSDPSIVEAQKLDDFQEGVGHQCPGCYTPEP